MTMDRANKANILLIVFNGVLLISQNGKSIDNDTENNVEKHNVNDDETGHIIHESHEELIPIVCAIGLPYHHITDTTR